MKGSHLGLIHKVVITINFFEDAMTSFQRLYRVAIKPSVFVSVFFIGLVLFIYADRRVDEYFYALNLVQKVPVLTMITFLGEAKFYVIVLFALALFYRYATNNSLYEQRFWFVWASVTVANVVSVAIKILLGRARPILWFKEHLFGFYGIHSHSQYLSMPSGHTTTVFSLALALGVLFPRYFWALMCFALTVASTRIFLTQHYLTDILSAAYLTIVVMGLLCKVLKRRNWLPLVSHAFDAK